MKLNVCIGMYYLITEFAFILKFVIYFFIEDISLLLLFEVITDVLLFTSLILLGFYNYILYKEEKGIKNSYLSLIVILYGSLLAILFMLPDALTIELDVPLNAIWSIPLGVQLAIVITAFCIIPSLILSLTILTRIKTREIRRRWSLFIIGEFGMFSNYYVIIMFYTLRFINPVLDLFFTLYFMNGIVVWGLFLYFGIGKELKE